MTETRHSLEAVEAEDLACVRGGRLVFRHLDFTALRGQAISLEGPNGAGKSSALRMLAGLLAAADGVVRFRAAAAEVTDSEERARYVAWLGHADGIKAQMSVLENARFGAALFSASGSVDEALARVGLARLSELPGQYLSAGQRRRLGLARLMLSQRPLWLLDEPLAALDSAGRRLAAELISDHCGGGGIAIAATHDALGVPGPRVLLGAA
jgi:heme exporter protein A